MCHVCTQFTMKGLVLTKTLWWPGSSTHIQVSITAVQVNIETNVWIYNYYYVIHYVHGPWHKMAQQKEVLLQFLPISQPWMVVGHLAIITANHGRLTSSRFTKSLICCEILPDGINKLKLAAEYKPWSALQFLWNEGKKMLVHNISSSGCTVLAPTYLNICER